MRFETSQSMKLGQHMKLAPRMIQSMEILQMPLAELQERIEQELESNIALELAEPEAPDADATEHEDAGVADEEFSRLDDYADDNPEAVANEFNAERERPWEPDSFQRVRQSGEPDAKMEAMANAPDRGVPLVDQLLAQWSLVEVDPVLVPLGRLLIEKLEDDGYLRVDLEKVADEAPQALQPVDPEALERALQAVQLFLDPAGVAARDARECLLLQLDAIREDEAFDDADDAPIRVARALVEDHLDDLMNNRLPKIAERAGLDLDEIKGGLALLRRLSLAPARRLVATRNEPVIPDAIVEYDENNDRYYSYLRETSWQNLQVNREYALLSKDRALVKRDRDFIKTNLSNANWLIDAVGQRKRTLLRVIDRVIHHQRDYFDLGPESLRPLPMSMVADELGIHVATVSRAVSEKWIQTPRGVVPLRGFFSGGLQTESGEDMSYDAVKAALKDVVETEDKAKPLSDEALVKELKARGIEIARRTVAKYRGQLDIPSARLRKKF